MKNKILILTLLFISLIACSSDENSNDEEEKIGSIIGKWVLVENCYYDTDTPRQCEEVAEANRFFFNFKEDGTVQTNRHNTECNTGTYELDNKELYILFECTDFLFTVEKTTNSQLNLNSKSDDGGLIYIYNKIN